MRSLRITSHLVMAAFLALSMLQGCSPENGEMNQDIEGRSTHSATVGRVADSETEGAARTASARDVRFVLVVSSQACQCTLEKCRESRLYLVETLKKLSSSPSLEVLDQASQEDRSALLVKKYGIRFIPTLLVLGRNGEVLQRYDWEIDREEFEGFLSQLGSAE